MIDNTTVKSIFSANGSTREFTLGFSLDTDVSDLVIQVKDSSGNITTVTTNYSLANGVLTYPTEASGLAPLASGNTLILYRETPATQEVSLSEQARFSMALFEAAYDKLTLLAQELTDKYSRCVKVPIISEETPDELLESITASKTAAAASASAAAVSETAAETAATNAAASAVTAQEAAESIVVDSALSSTSEHPVQNKVITNALSGLSYIGYGICSSGLTTAAKTVTISGIGTSFTVGQMIVVSFTNGNRADEPTLNVNGAGAVDISSMAGKKASLSSPFYAPVGAKIKFIWNGTGWSFENSIVKSFRDEANFTITGSPTISKAGILSAASASNYITLNKSIAAATSAFSYKFKIVTPASFTANTVLIGRASAYTGMFFMLDASGNLTWYGSSNGTSNDIASGAATGLTLSVSSTYWVRMVWDGTAYTPGISASGSLWTDGTAVTNSNALYAFTPLIGLNAPSAEYNYFGGSIYLDSIEILKDTVSQWTWNGAVGTGKNWYVEYSDGKIEQGGILDSDSSSITFTVAFRKSTYRLTGAPAYNSAQPGGGIDLYSYDHTIYSASLAYNYASASAAAYWPVGTEWSAKGY